MGLKIALAGNPNSGKTTMFNELTGSAQYVGNWPGVTVEKKEGRLKGNEEAIIQDLPGIYSLSPYTLEEVVARNYLVTERPDAIINIVDGSNIERNLYLTTQLLELGIPTIIALNMIDVVRKNGDVIDLTKLGGALGCEVVETSALKGIGAKEAAAKAIAVAKSHALGERPHVFSGSVEHAIAHIEESIEQKVEPQLLRWYAVKLFERDEKVLEALQLDDSARAHVEGHIADCERELDDDAESIITNQRYAYISRVVDASVKKKHKQAVATLTGLIAKENVVNTFGVLYGFAEVAEDGMEIWSNLALDFTALSAFSFMLFNLLCAPCFAAMGAIKTEMRSGKWTWAAIGYMTVFAYAVSLIVFQLGRWFGTGSFTAATGVSLLLLGTLLYFLLRKNPYEKKAPAR